MALLKLLKDDPQKELEFEVKCALEEDPNERLKKWFPWNMKMLKMAEKKRNKLFPDTEKYPLIVKRSINEP